MSADFEKTVLAEIREMKDALSYRTSWIAGYVALGRYLGSSDRQGRVARAWATEEKPLATDKFRSVQLWHGIF